MAGRVRERLFDASPSDVGHLPTLLPLSRFTQSGDRDTSDDEPPETHPVGGMGHRR